MTLTDEQCERLKRWLEVTPEEVAARIAPELEKAWDNPEVMEKIANAVLVPIGEALKESDQQWQQALGATLEPIIKRLKEQERRIEKLEAALFRRILS